MTEQDAYMLPSRSSSTRRKILVRKTWDPRRSLRKELDNGSALSSECSSTYAERGRVKATTADIRYLLFLRIPLYLGSINRSIFRNPSISFAYYLLRPKSTLSVADCFLVALLALISIKVCQSMGQYLASFHREHFRFRRAGRGAAPVLRASRQIVCVIIPY